LSLPEAAAVLGLPGYTVRRLARLGALGPTRRVTERMDVTRAGVEAYRAYPTRHRLWTHATAACSVSLASDAPGPGALVQVASDGPCTGVPPHPGRTDRTGEPDRAANPNWNSRGLTT
jgi:hypothetical protein